MSENTYTATVNTTEVYDLMAQHAKVTMEANSVAFERLFETDELDPVARAEALQRELDLVTQANSLAFQIADSFMSEGFVAGFQDHLMASLTSTED
jgi:hypothetical protein